jgi:hypothetical protein
MKLMATINAGPISPTADCWEVIEYEGHKYIVVNENAGKRRCLKLDESCIKRSECGGPDDFDYVGGLSISDAEIIPA